jgi:hypothetical protein
MAQFTSKPKNIHFKYIKRIFQYIKATKDLCLKIDNTDDMTLCCYVDASYADNLTDRKSTTGYTFFLGKTSITWKTKKQSLIAKSTMEAELYAMEHAIKNLYG